MQIRDKADIDREAFWKKPEYCAGLDLGQAQDFTALAIVEVVGVWGHCDFKLGHLERWPLGTSYPQIVEDVAARMGSLPEGRVSQILAVDNTGVGRAVSDLFSKARRQWELVPVNITAGHQATKQGLEVFVPKKDLVAAVNIPLQTKRLQIASSLQHAETLRKELLNFKATIRATGHMTYGADADWRVGNHDDLVLAVALALWIGTRPRSHIIGGTY